MKFIPNALSILRLVLSFALIPFILKNDISVVIIIFMIAALSDFFDGYLARLFKASSILGSILDPLADKTLIIISYFLFAYIELIPAYLAIIVILRDILILLVVLICRFLNISLKMKPLMSSKINTAIQLVFIVSVLSCKYLSINVSCLMEACSAIVCAITIFSGVEYVQKYYWIKDELFK